MQIVRRDYAEEARERDRYVILLHLRTLELAGFDAGQPLERIARDLAIKQADAESLVAGLVRSGHVEFWTTTPGVTLTSRGVDYIERRAGRRRSLRLLR